MKVKKRLWGRITSGALMKQAEVKNALMSQSHRFCSGEERGKTNSRGMIAGWREQTEKEGHTHTHTHTDGDDVHSFTFIREKQCWIFLTSPPKDSVASGSGSLR